MKPLEIQQSISTRAFCWKSSNSRVCWKSSSTQHYFTCHSCCHLLALLPQRAPKRGNAARTQGVLRNGNYYPEISKADLKKVYLLAKNENSGVKENDLKNLRGLLAYVSAFEYYPSSRASVSELYKVLLKEDKEGDDAKVKVRAFFKSLKDDFGGYIPNNEVDVPFLHEFADRFGDWHTQLITAASPESLKQVTDGKAPLVPILEKYNLLTPRRDEIVTKRRDEKKKSKK